MSKSLDDKAVIEAFVSYLKGLKYPNLKVDRWPDKENRDSSDIDAIAGSFAIEHTSIDTVNNQRRDSAWFTQVVKGIEEKLSGKLTYRLNITIPYNGIQLGQKWTEINKSMETWIMKSSSNLPDGLHIINNIPGIPFEFNVRKSTGRKAVLFFSRFSPKDDSLSNRIHEQLERKAKKLEPYHKQTYSTVLLVESNDIALMNEAIMIDAIRNSFSKSLPSGVEQIWYADTTIPDELLFHDFTKIITSD
ncbi:MAG TPA: hypothetical protein VJB90_04595 [Candidatus Nanoarchaeia archaeon]|nr:hypothetical protein [Candidatus Nanoarchaeia archaeon]